MTSVEVAYQLIAAKPKLPTRRCHTVTTGSRLADRVTTLLGPGRNGDPLALLTQREREVLELVAEGRSNAGIAGKLWLTDRTVETHAGSITAKLGLRASDDEHRRALAVLTFLGVRPVQES